jgi:peptidoglycan hydrolase CwlO-like protein
VILSKDEKKAVVVELKAKIKSAKDTVKQLVGIRKEADKALAVASKLHIATLKANDKEAAAGEKELFSLEAQLTALTAPVAA